MNDLFYSYVGSFSPRALEALKAQRPAQISWTDQVLIEIAQEAGYVVEQGGQSLSILTRITKPITWTTQEVHVEKKWFFFTRRYIVNVEHSRLRGFHVLKGSGLQQEWYLQRREDGKLVFVPYSGPDYYLPMIGHLLRVAGMEEEVPLFEGDDPIIEVPAWVRNLGWEKEEYVLRSEVAGFIRQINAELKEFEENYY